ncbi:hypothetical protein PRZ48_000369 [Zasmidium cellare]|uniref:Cellulose-binding protein n=1 Tax=Zasmidium cellare TaxID=395010 RepID=A0ABR0EYB4_ZASCE|nr:hypothetical protein PRZ48_000369 [Zasmidium cellare]
MGLLQYGLLGTALCAVLSNGQRCAPAIQLDKKPQVFIMSDISNEPDDTMSFIRLLVHSDHSVVPEQILNTTHAHGQVVDNLNRHSAGEFPTSEYLSSIVKAGHPVYGTAAIGKSPLSSGASRLIDVADGMGDDEVLFTQAWGGVNVLAEALFHVRATRPQIEIDRFVKKLRVYTISDQDNAGPWIRSNFPTIPYIVSLHGFNQYRLATWIGISGDTFYGGDGAGPDSSLVSPEYIARHFQIGPLGSHYPDVAYIMEGDSPSLMHTMNNGLNGGPFDFPEWGGWGGRYILIDPSRQTMVYSDTTDVVVGKDNNTYKSNHATIWRWRQAFQDEMSARIQWTIQSNYSAGSHPPVVSVNGSCGSAPYLVDVDPEQEITLDGSATYDPDSNITGRNPLQYKWYQYRDVSASQSNVESVPQLNFTLSDDGRIATTKLPTAELACAAVEAVQNQGLGVQESCQQYHVILEVTGSGSPPIRRYKRTILKVRPPTEDMTSAKSKRDEL